MTEHSFLWKEKICKLESHLNTFYNSMVESIHAARGESSTQQQTIKHQSNTTRDATCSTGSANSYADDDNSNINNNLIKSHVVQASKFLQSLHQKLYTAESSLVTLVDSLILLEGGLENKENVGDCGQEEEVQRSFNGRENFHKMQLSDLSKQLRYMHALHAKQILHVESLLVSQYGYVTVSQQQQESHDDYSLHRDHDHHQNYDHYFSSTNNTKR